MGKPAISQHERPKTAAARVIRAFGGARKLAAELGIRPEAVYRWDYPKHKRGCSGTIPSEWHRLILEVAAKRNIALAPVDLINV